MCIYIYIYTTISLGQIFCTGPKEFHEHPVILKCRELLVSFLGQTLCTYKYIYIYIYMHIYVYIYIYIWVKARYAQQPVQKYR